MTKIYYQKSDAIILVYDITNKESFNNLKDMYNEIKETIEVTQFLLFIVGNKNDLYENEIVAKEEVKLYAQSINADYRCVSALDSTGINELFELVGKQLFLQFKNESQADISNMSEIKVALTTNEHKKKEKNKTSCC